MSPDSPPTPDATPQPTPQPAHDPTPDDGWADLFRRLLSLADPPADTAAGRPAYDAVAADLLARLRPRDPAEELLAVQMLATHARALFLARHATRQKNPKWFALYSAHAQQSADLFRRQMLALAGIPPPPPPPVADVQRHPPRQHRPSRHVPVALFAGGRPCRCSSPKPRSGPTACPPAGRRALSASVARHQPWLHSTGPRSPLGKAIVSQNALKHGLHSRRQADQRRAFLRHLRQMRDAATPTTQPPTWVNGSDPPTGPV